MTIMPQVSREAVRAVGRLGAVCRSRGPRRVAARLEDLEAWISDDLAVLDAELTAVPLGESVVRLSARHQLELGGKLLRPVCVVLAAKMGRGFGPEARDVAVAVELIHNATLLHDDVIDLGARRRGAPAARAIYGNAASVLAGDWLLVQAIRRIHRRGESGLLAGALDTLEQMIAAEALELENRGRLDLDRADYFRVVDGKTAALFRWAMHAGATVGGLAPDQRALLTRYGEHLGVAFQLVDDLLDVSGDPAVTGKAVLSDLAEGKMTYPLLLALERDATLRRELERILGRDEAGPLPTTLCARLQRRLLATGSVHDCRALARRHASDALACLDRLPNRPSREALATLAAAAVERHR